jgi:hypothetical protein
LVRGKVREGEGGIREEEDGFLGGFSFIEFTRGDFGGSIGRVREQ